MPVIKHTSPKLYIDESVVLVGSSDKLAGSCSGKLINDYVDVIRFNAAPLLGFEEDVGSRETLRVVNSYIFAGKDKDRYICAVQNNRILTRTHEDLYPCRAASVDQSCSLYRTEYRYPCESYRFNSDRHLTIGLMMVMLCVESGIKPSIIGFDTEHRNIRTHYWETKKRGTRHDFSAEAELLLSLRSAGDITILET